MSNESYIASAGFYKTADGGPAIYLGADGVIVVGYDTYSSGGCTAGTYALEKGTLTVTLANAYNGKKTLTGTYYTKYGKTYITLDIGNGTSVTCIYEKEGE